jgi:hypothetical protein
MPVKRIPVILVTIVLALFAAGCFSSDNPLSEEAAAEPDRGLEGKWLLEFETGDVSYLGIQVIDSRHMKLIRSNQSEPRKGIDEIQEFVIFPTAAKGQKFLNLEMPLPSRDPDEKKKTRRGYWFYKYQFLKDGTILLQTPTYEAIKEAVEKGALKGNAWETTWASNVDLTDSSTRILDWLIGADPKNDFSRFGTMKRLR